MDSDKLKKLVKEEVQKQLKEYAPVGTFSDNNENDLMPPRHANFVSDGLVHLWNSGIKKGIKPQHMAEYMMNWSKMAFKDAMELDE